MSHIAINNTSIRRDANGRYCLNDLHRAAGGEKRHQPSDFLRTQHTSDLVAELTDPENPGAAPAAPVQTIRGGAEQGTYVAKELVYAYAMWISAAFHLKVIRTFDAVQHQSAPAPTFQVPTTLAGALRLAAEQAEAIERQQQLLEEQRPKVEFVERYVDAGGTFGFRQTAKLLGANESEFRAFLIDKRIMYRLGGVLAPYQQHIDAGRFDIKTGVSNSSTHVYAQAKFTPKGVQWVAGLWMAAQLPEQVKA
ncbi:hypothetical protein [Ralstonia phage RPZH3]|nr:hypothetical protein [Ralstonia phage RPZH6]UAW00997.1 hypothetical protein [Ralstonia phage RPZH3]